MNKAICPKIDKLRKEKIQKTDWNNQKNNPFSDWQSFIIPYPITQSIKSRPKKQLGIQYGLKPRTKERANATMKLLTMIIHVLIPFFLNQA